MGEFDSDGGLVLNGSLVSDGSLNRIFLLWGDYIQWVAGAIDENGFSLEERNVQGARWRGEMNRT
jgi:hypothetical protein